MFNVITALQFRWCPPQNFFPDYTASIGSVPSWRPAHVVIKKKKEEAPQKMEESSEDDEKTGSKRKREDEAEKEERRKPKRIKKLIYAQASAPR